MKNPQGISIFVENNVKRQIGGRKLGENLEFLKKIRTPPQWLNKKGFFHKNTLTHKMHFQGVFL